MKYELVLALNTPRNILFRVVVEADGELTYEEQEEAARCVTRQATFLYGEEIDEEKQG